MQKFDPEDVEREEDKDIAMYMEKLIDNVNWYGYND